MPFLFIVCVYAFMRPEKGNKLEGMPQHGKPLPSYAPLWTKDERGTVGESKFDR